LWLKFLAGKMGATKDTKSTKEKRIHGHNVCFFISAIRAICGPLVVMITFDVKLSMSEQEFVGIK